MPSYLVDTYAWIDYFRGVRAGRLKEILEGGGNITPTIVLAELKRKYVREDIQNFNTDLAYIRRKSAILDLDQETAILAGEISATIGSRLGMGLVDCILLALARLKASKVLTGDRHFIGMPEAEMIEGLGTGGP